MSESDSIAAFVVISGASGSGKTSLCRLAAERLGFHYAISHTTRPKRTGEKEGLHYHFVDMPSFQSMIDHGDFLEWATVYGNFYGTSRKEVEENLFRGKGVIIDVDTQGAMSLKKAYPQSILIFLKTPTHKDLETRLVNRGTETEEARAHRLKHVHQEEEKSQHYDYVLINEDLEETFKSLEKIIKLVHSEGMGKTHAQT